MAKATRILSHFDNLPTGELVDQLGSVKAEIADLETRQQSLRAELLKRCITEAEGAVYAATVTQAVRWTLDAKAVRAELGDDCLERALQAIAGHDRHRRGPCRLSETRGKGEGEPMTREPKAGQTAAAVPNPITTGTLPASTSASPCGSTPAMWMRAAPPSFGAATSRARSRWLGNWRRANAMRRPLPNGFR